MKFTIALTLISLSFLSGPAHASLDKRICDFRVFQTKSDVLGEKLRSTLVYSQTKKTYTGVGTGVGYYQVNEHTQINGDMGWKNSFDNTEAAIRVYALDADGDYSVVAEERQEGLGPVSMTLTYGEYEAHLDCRTVTAK